MIRESEIVMTDRNIDDLIEELIDREGGYVNHSADRGGPTRWGITEAVARRQGYMDDLRHLPQSDAAAIYKRLYWVAPGFDKVALTAPRLAEELFDTGVNMGTGTATGFRLMRLIAMAQTIAISLSTAALVQPHSPRSRHSLSNAAHLAKRYY